MLCDRKQAMHYLGELRSGSRAGPTPPGVASPVLGGGEGSPPLTCWHYFAKCSPKNITCLLSSKGTLLVYFLLGVHQNPQVLFCQAAFQLGGFSRWHVLVPGVVHYQVQNFALLLVELHKVIVSPALQPIKVPLDGSMALWWVRCSPYVCVICGFTEGTFYPIIQIGNGNALSQRCCCLPNVYIYSGINESFPVWKGGKKSFYTSFHWVYKSSKQLKLS